MFARDGVVRAQAKGASSQRNIGREGYARFVALELSLRVDGARGSRRHRSTASLKIAAMRHETPLRNQLFGHRKTAARSGVYATSRNASTVTAPSTLRSA